MPFVKAIHRETVSIRALRRVIIGFRIDTQGFFIQARKSRGYMEAQSGTPHRTKKKTLTFELSAVNNWHLCRLPMSSGNHRFALPHHTFTHIS